MLNLFRAGALFLVAVTSACATSGGTGPGEAKPPRTGRSGRGRGTQQTASTNAPLPVEPPCKPHVVELAPVGKSAGAAHLDAGKNGYVAVWSEHGERETLRFLAVDPNGVPTSPSVEIADRKTAIMRPLVVQRGDGYVVTWSEGDEVFSRRLDPRGRLLSDVEPGEDVAAGAVSACSASDGTMRCKSPTGEVLDLPAGEKLLSEASSRGLAVISSGTSGLRFWLLDCAKPAR